VDVERALICKILAEKDLTEVSDKGVNPTFIEDATNRRVFSTLLELTREHAQVPTVAMMRRDFPKYDFIKVAEPLTYLVDQVRRNHALSILEEALSDAVVIFEDKEDPDAITRILSRTLNTLAAELPNTRDTDLTKTGEQRLERYRSLRDESGLRGIPSGFHSIDRATQGFQPGQLCTVVGPPKAGKSTTMLLAARNAHRMGFLPLLIGFEMTNEEQEERIDAIAAGISLQRLRSAGSERYGLDAEEWKRLTRSIHEIETMRSFILSGDTQSTTTLTGVMGKVEKYRPDLLIVDGVYMMQDENGEPPGSPQALTNITRGFKRMAQNLNIPIIITTQVLTWKMDKKRGITGNSIGYSSSFAQDSDVILGVETTDDPNINKVKIVLARNCPPSETYVQWDWDTSTFEELTANPFDPDLGGDDQPDNYDAGKVSY